jgi:hypothetical protein
VLNWPVREKAHEAQYFVYRRCRHHSVLVAEKRQAPAEDLMLDLRSRLRRFDVAGCYGGTVRMLWLALLIFAKVLFGNATAFAAEPMPPAEIRSTFFTGQPFTAVSLSGTKFKMTFTPDGKMTREPLEQTGSKNSGTWKLNSKGFCTAWGRAAPNCFTIIPSGENKWSVQKIATTIATTVAVWSK